VDHLPSRHWALILLLLVLPAAGSACGSDGRSGGAGGKIAFSAPLDGEYRLFIANADGSGKPTVAPGPSGVGFPVWSPDGSKIAFSDSDSVSTYISSVRADGSHYTRLFDDQNSGTQFVWSGKSDRIAYDWTAIFVVGAAGGGRRLLVHGHFPSWSPDGRMVAFLRGRFVRVINSVGTGERKLARIDGAAEGYVQLLWSSDSRQIAYSTSSWKNPKTSCESGGDCNDVVVRSRRDASSLDVEPRGNRTSRHSRTALRPRSGRSAHPASRRRRLPPRAHGALRRRAGGSR
jgi:Tol biopolymer transport system component